MNKHLAAIRAGAVTKSNVIGLQKAVRADYRRARGWGVGATAPNLQGEELAETLRELHARQPLVTGDLVASGIKTLQDRRYRKRLAKVADTLASLDAFRLCGFEFIGERDAHLATVYLAESRLGGSFKFYHVPWQAAAYSGLDAGPHVIEVRP